MLAFKHLIQGRFLLQVAASMQKRTMEMVEALYGMNRVLSGTLVICGWTLANT
jgi:hypothetical protein